MKQVDSVVYDKVILADSYPVFASALKCAISACSSVVALIEASHFDELLDQIKENYTPSKPPLLILDVRLPGGRGVLGLSELKAQFPSLPVVVIHDAIYHETTLGLLGQTFAGVITRQTDEKLLHIVINRFLKGDRCSSEQWHSPVSHLATGAAQLFQLESLSKSQLRVIKGVLKGRANKKIAYELCVSESTVKVHMTNILKQFGVRSRSELIVTLLSPEMPCRRT